jgi:uroporphyrinogen decarboxylase
MDSREVLQMQLRTSVAHGCYLLRSVLRFSLSLSLSPGQRFDLDAAIIFSDILVIPQALGLDVQMQEGVGPVLPQPIRDPSHLARLKKFDTPAERAEVLDSLSYVYAAIHLCRHSLQGRVPLIGFCGAPWTLFCYMTEGGGAKSYTDARAWLFTHPSESAALLDLITAVLIGYLVRQVEAGAQMLEVFDTWSGELTAECFQEFVLPRVARIAHEVKKQTKAKGFDVPMTLFAKGQPK